MGYMGAAQYCKTGTNRQVLPDKSVDIHYPKAKEKAKGKKRVAAYCRVSTDSNEQLGSLENQISAFRFQVDLRDDWQLVKIYSDEGVTGTNTSHRKGFLKMIEDCKNGKIDYVITKSISRFARNTVDCLNYVRQLQSLGVELYFEKEGIDTADITSEMLLVIMAAFAQEESRSISENTKWGVRKRFEAGKETRIPIYGYRHTENEMYIVEPEEAAIVKEVFTRYAHGETSSEIMQDMIARNVPPPAGDRWKTLQIWRMLHNEKYIGDAVLQKYYIENHLTHKEVKNKGELPIYHISNAHPAIIDRHLFAQAGAIAGMRDVRIGRSSYPYNTMLKCPYCGETLEHGCLLLLRIGGQKFSNGGWGCYGPNGCKQYLMIQNLLDTAMITAYKQKYGKTLDKVDYYWLDDLVDRIELGEDLVTVCWKDGDKQTLLLTIPRKQYLPKQAAQKYNCFLDRVKTGETRVKEKYIMGLYDTTPFNANKRRKSHDHR